MNTPQGLLEQGKGERRYTKRKQLTDLAETIFNSSGRGLEFNDLIKHRIVEHKKQAQWVLKYAQKEGVLFTLKKRRPQKYYPMTIKAKIIERLTKNTPREVTGVDNNNTALVGNTESIVIQTLENYILPLMTTSPLYIHKLHLKVKLTPDCYLDLPIHSHRQNKAKECAENIGNNRVTYLFYPNGTVLVTIQNSNNPLKLQTEYDRSHFLTVFGQVRDRLIFIISDIHERLVPKVLEWELTQCDINKDIAVNDFLQFSGIKIQVKHLDHLFRLYIKSMGKDTILRVEESKTFKKATGVEDTINQIFNPNEITNELLRQEIQELLQIKYTLKQLTDAQVSKN